MKAIPATALAILSALISLSVSAKQPPVNLENNPLMTPVRASELKAFDTVGDASKYILGRVSYQLKLTWPAPADSAFVASLPIRPSAITGSVLPIQELLASMVSEKYIVVVDHATKQVSFAKREEKNFIPESTRDFIFDGQYIVPDPRIIKGK